MVLIPKVGGYQTCLEIFQHEPTLSSLDLYRNRLGLRAWYIIRNSSLMIPPTTLRPGRLETCAHQAPGGAASVPVHVLKEPQAELASCPTAQVRGSAHSEPGKGRSWGKCGCEHRPHVSRATKRGGSMERGWKSSFNSSSSTAEPSTTGFRHTQPGPRAALSHALCMRLNVSIIKSGCFSP